MTTCNCTLRAMVAPNHIVPPTLGLDLESHYDYLLRTFRQTRKMFISAELVCSPETVPDFYDANLFAPHHVLSRARDALAGLERC